MGHSNADTSVKSCGYVSEELMKELANDTARFELRSEESIQRSPFASISLGRRQRPNFCFARISSIQ